MEQQNQEIQIDAGIMIQTLMEENNNCNQRIVTLRAQLAQAYAGVNGLTAQVNALVEQVRALGETPVIEQPEPQPPTPIKKSPSPRKKTTSSSRK